MLGRLNIAYGILGALISSVAFVSGGGILGFYRWFDDRFFGLMLTTTLTAQLLMAPLCLIGGIFVRRYHDWARIFLIVVSALNSLNFPVGSLLGVYGLWVLLTPETEPLFTDRPPAQGKGKKVAGKKAIRAASKAKASSENSDSPSSILGLKRAAGD
ncbi:MAG: hypothetical protein HYS04_02080 [Acidobacteria bacterium]|nr:hypothetical protein [Acidobacteriota bacterium]